jgi:hypothetical protein
VSATAPLSQSSFHNAKGDARAYAITWALLMITVLKTADSEHIVGNWIWLPLLDG